MKLDLVVGWIIEYVPLVQVVLLVQIMKVHLALPPQIEYVPLVKVVLQANIRQVHVLQVKTQFVEIAHQVTRVLVEVQHLYQNQQDQGQKNPI